MSYSANNVFFYTPGSPNPDESWRDAPIGRFASAASMKAALLNDLATLYAGSAKARSLLDALAGGTSYLRIAGLSNSLESPGYALWDGQPFNTMELDYSQLDNLYSFNMSGELVQGSRLLVIAHELQHLASHTYDPSYSDGAMNGPTFDYRGPQVDAQNTVAVELGLTDQHRLAYNASVYRETNGKYDLLYGHSYTNGYTVSVARLGSNDVNDMDHSSRVDASADLFFGFGGNDLLDGGKGNDHLYGGGDDDDVKGGDGDDWLYGDGENGDVKQSGNDRLFGGKGEDHLFGGPGTDELTGGADADYLDGGPGVDKIFDLEKEDTLAGGDGSDILMGGAVSEWGIERGSDVLAFMPDRSVSDGDYIIRLTDLNSSDVELFGGGSDIYGGLALGYQENVEIDWFGIRAGGQTFVVLVTGISQAIADSNGVLPDDFYPSQSGGYVWKPWLGGPNTSGNFEPLPYKIEFADGSVWDGRQILNKLQVDPLNTWHTYNSSNANASTYTSSVYDRYLFPYEEYRDHENSDSSEDGSEADDVGSGNSYSNLFSGNGGDDEYDGKDGDDVIYGGSGDDTLAGGGGNDRLYGQGGNDTLHGGNDNDMLSGGAGNDALDGGTGDDKLAGGDGLDTLSGGIGSDSYRRGANEGIDLIVETSAAPDETDLLTIEGTRSDTLSIFRLGNDLWLGDQISGGAALIQGHFGGPVGRGIEVIRLADQTELSRADVDGLAKLPIMGSLVADALSGTSQADYFLGGPGADMLSGGEGSDVYAYAQGDGNDVINDTPATFFGTDSLLFSNVDPAGITVARQIDNLVVTVLTTGEAITIAGQFTLVASAGDAPGIERIEFQNGETWDRAKIEAATAIRGTISDDSLIGTANGDLFVGGGDNDTINGLGGVDTAAYSDAWQYYDVTIPSAGLAIVADRRAGEDGTDQLTAIERLSFDGQTFDVADAVNYAPAAMADDYFGVVEATAGDPGFGYAGGSVLDNDEDANLNSYGLGERLKIDGAAAGGSAAVVTSFADSVTLTGAYGSLTLNSNGSYLYTLDNESLATDGLSDGDLAQDTFTYRVTDIHGAQSSANLVINIDGRTDNTAPTAAIDTDIAVNQIVEGAQPGVATGLTARADDVDIGQTVTYRLTDDAGGRFAIDAVTGVVSVANAALIDFESAETHAVTVVANDGIADSLLSIFNIAVVDAAPSAPIDTDTVATNNLIAENSGAGAAVSNLVLDSTDPNGGLVTYVLDDPSGKFAIDTITHHVILKAGETLDYEYDPHTFVVSVVASDSNGMASASTSFTVGLTNIVEDQAHAGTFGDDVWTAPSDDNWRVFPLAGNDTIITGAGNDYIAGGPGDDDLSGGAGDDIFVFSYQAGFPSDDFDIIDGGSGNDTIKALSSNTTIGLRSVRNVETITANGFSQVLLSGSVGNDYLDFSASSIVGIARIDAGAGDDIVRGTVAADVIRGSAGNDAIAGGGGDDTFEYTGTTGGADMVDGGTGTDTIKAVAANTVIGLNSLTTVEAISSGGFAGVTVSVSGSSALDFTNALLTGIVRIDGSADANTIIGAAGADTIRGNAGDDTVSGGAGNDVFEFTGTAGGFDNVDGGAGSDTLKALVNNTIIGLHNLSAVEVITAGTFTGVTVAGSGGDDSLDFSGATLTGIVRIDAGAGNDLITGTTAADTIRGNAGDDALIGAFGDDVFEFTGTASGFDSIDGGAGNDSLKALANGSVIGLKSLVGIETVTAGTFTNVTIAGSSGADSLDFSSSTLTGITRIDAGAGNDTIIGSAGADTIRGGVGDDTLYGGGGDDIIDYAVGSNGYDVVNGGTGTDTVRAAASNVTIGLASFAGIEAISSNGFANISLSTGAASDTLDARLITISGIASIDLGAGNDTFYGTTTADKIAGGAGDDTLAGDAGNDVFNFSGTADGFDAIDGGAGTDTIGALNNDTVIGLTSLTGIETVTANSKTNVTVLGSSTDNVLDFTGVTVTGIVRVDGGAGNDTMTGNGIANTLLGGAGDDFLQGAAGNDTLDGGAGDDTAIFAGLSTDYTVTTIGNSTTVKDLKTSVDGNDGTDTLVGIEHLQFKDSVVLSVSSTGLGTDDDDRVNSFQQRAGAARSFVEKSDDTLISRANDRRSSPISSAPLSEALKSDNVTPDSGEHDKSLGRGVDTAAASRPIVDPVQLAARTLLQPRSLSLNTSETRKTPPAQMRYAIAEWPTGFGDARAERLIAAMAAFQSGSGVGTLSQITASIDTAIAQLAPAA